jgi:2-oxoglutarate dehydrogenase E1 component
MDELSFLTGVNTEVIEELYKKYKNNPEDLDSSWKNFFKGYEFAKSSKHDGDFNTEHIDKEFKVINYIHAYRKRGHLFTKTNPVRIRRKYSPTLDLENYGLSQDDLNEVFQAGKEIGIGTASLREIKQHLEETYCESVGSEYMFIRKPDRTYWLQQKLEKSKNKTQFKAEEKKKMFDLLNRAVGFEQFIHKKFIGQKRFSLEGTEALIPALHYILLKGSSLGISEYII